MADYKGNADLPGQKRLRALWRDRCRRIICPFIPLAKDCERCAIYLTLGFCAERKNAAASELAAAFFC
ncbi:hypothetical protein [Burkholderia sp. S171]|uniref:hypothetical protein n=1 Tax=Burkholderia sp. S171 TaxID=1641860 RepID=UPI00131B174D|nr:hypothetical protein [Burkholderia sp. S171]